VRAGEVHECSRRPSACRDPMRGLRSERDVKSYPQQRRGAAISPEPGRADAQKVMFTDALLTPPAKRRNRTSAGRCGAGEQFCARCTPARLIPDTRTVKRAMRR
jgi:hypothetical protein